MSNTYYAKRANKIIAIPEESIEKYKGAGYTITDASGSLVTSGTPHGAQLVAAYTKLQGEVDNLKAQIERLTAENLMLSTELESAKTESKPTRKRRQSVEPTTEE